MPFCNCCGTKFEIWESENGWSCEHTCPSCWEHKYDSPVEVKGNRFCIDCGKPTGTITVQSENRKPYKRGASKRCADCRTARKLKLKPPPKLVQPKKNDPEAIAERMKRHSEKSMKWQRENRHKVKAGQLARYYVESLDILYECPCDVPFKKKHKHHPDYLKPLEVIVLCPKCHAGWHAKLRQMNRHKRCIG